MRKERYDVGDRVIYDPTYKIDRSSTWYHRRGARFEVVSRIRTRARVVWRETDPKYKPPESGDGQHLSFPNEAFRLDPTFLIPDWEV